LARQRLTTGEAAQHLRISPDAVRKRVSRGQLDSEKTPDGKLYIWLDTDTPAQDRDDRDQLIEFLHEQLEHEREVNRENRRIIAGLVQRIPPALEEAPSEPRESPETASESGGRGDAPEEEKQRPWWRFW
jgi:hypothetical protein